MKRGVERLVSLNWDQPLPCAVVALTLRPDALTIVAPRSAEASTRRLQEVLERHGIAVDIVLGEDATELDKAGDAEPMRTAILGALHADPRAVLDYTGGSKMMAAVARQAVEPDADSRAVYLDVRSGTLRWDDGGEKPSR